MDVGFTYDPVTGLPAGMAAGHPHLLVELAFVVPTSLPYAQVADVPYDAAINVAAGSTGVDPAGTTRIYQRPPSCEWAAALSRVQFGEIAAVGRSIGFPFANVPVNNARILPDNYGYGNATMATRAGSPQAVHYLSMFVEWAKKKGLIQRANQCSRPSAHRRPGSASSKGLAGCFNSATNPSLKIGGAAQIRPTPPSMVSAMLALTCPAASGTQRFAASVGGGRQLRRQLRLFLTARMSGPPVSLGRAHRRSSQSRLFQVERCRARSGAAVDDCLDFVAAVPRRDWTSGLYMNLQSTVRNTPSSSPGWIVATSFTTPVAVPDVFIT
jgi:hypothetical protein